MQHIFGAFSVRLEPTSVLVVLQLLTQSYTGANDKNLLKVRLDVTDQSSIKTAFDEALAKFNRIDVLVNNAGYGLGGEFESYTDEQIRTQMEVNFFGLLNVTRVGLEIMRDVNRPQGGLIQQVTSFGGQLGVPNFSIYCASKWAVEGFTEAVSKEVKPEWGVKLQCVEPGGFRTDWAGRSMAFGEKETAYDHLNAEETMGKRHGTQVGSPPKAASAMYELATMKDPPLRCILGSDAWEAIQGKLNAYKENYGKYEQLIKGTDVDEKDKI